MDSQTASLSVFQPGVLAGHVGIGARTVIADAGYAHAFTHRLGHGIGIKAHEPPYLHKRNKAPLRADQVFTSEPGIYLQGDVGVWHEDVVLGRSGKGGKEVDILSGTRAKSPWVP